MGFRFLGTRVCDALAPYSVHRCSLEANQPHYDAEQSPIDDALQDDGSSGHDSCYCDDGDY